MASTKTNLQTTQNNVGTLETKTQQLEGTCQTIQTKVNTLETKVQQLEQGLQGNPNIRIVD